MIASILTSQPGISRVFKGGIVCYSEFSKSKILRVSKQIIMEKSAVSEEVAREMANGCIRLFESDVACSITGYAGPSAPKGQLGLVFIGVATKDHCVVRDFRLQGSRDEIRESATETLLKLAVEFLELPR